MPNVQEFAAKFTGDTSDFESAASRVEQRSQGLSQNLGAGLALGAGAAVGMAAFDALAGGIGAATSSAMDFEKTMSGVKAVSGASQSELSSLSQLALKLGADTSFSASQAASGIEELVKGGVSIADIMGGAAKASLDLAAAGGTTVAESATIAANAMAQFGIKGSEMAHVSDLIAGAANASAIDVNDFKFSLSSAGAVASTVGFSFDDLAQAIAVMGQAGIKGSDAGTSLKTMMLNLQPSTKAQVAEFERLGIVGLDSAKAQSILTDALMKSAEGQKAVAALQKDGTATADNLYKAANKLGLQAVAGTEDFNRWASVTGLMGNQFFDASGKVKSMSQVAGILQTSMEGMSEAERLASLEILFGSDAIRAGAVLAKAGAAGFDEMAASMGKVSAASVAEDRLDNLWGSIEKLKGSLETAAITLGTAFMPTLKGLADAATDAVNNGIVVLGDAWQTLGQVFTDDWSPSDAINPLVNAIGIAGGAIKNDLLPPAQELVGFLGEHTEIIVGFGAALLGLAAVAATAAAIAGVTAAIVALTSPIGLVLVAIGLLTAAWVGNWGDIQGKTSEATAFIGGSFDALGTTIDTTWTGIQASTETAWTAMQESFTTGTGAVSSTWETGWKAIEATQTAAWDVLTPENQAKMKELQDATDELWRTLGELWQAGWDAVSQTTTTKWDEISAKWNAEQEDISAKTDPFWTDIKQKWDASLTELSGRIGATWDQIVADTSTFWGNVFNEFVKADGELTAKAMELGGNIIKGIIDAINAGIGGIADALTGGVRNAINAARGMIPGGGQASLGGSGGGKARQYSSQIARVSSETGVPADVLAGILDTENSGASSVSPAGARGVMQVVPGQGYDMPGENWADPYISLLQGARALQDKFAATGDWEKAAGAYFGYGTDAGGMTTGGYVDRFRQNRSQYTFQGGAAAQVNQFSMGLAPDEAQAACGPAALEWFLNMSGRLPSAQEARDLAAAAGWDSSRGMYGPGAFGNALSMAGLTPNVDYSPTSGEIAGLAAAGQPFALSTAGGAGVPGHYYQVSGGDLSGLNVGGSGEALRGGSGIMSLDQITAMSGPINAIISLTGQMGSGFIQVGGIVDTQAGIMAGAMAAAGASITQGMDLETSTVVAVGSAMQDLGGKSAELGNFLASNLASGTDTASEAMNIFADRMAPMAAQVSAGGVSFDTLATSIVSAASSSGLATQPFADLSNGLITQEQAITQVIDAAAATNPVYAALAQQVTDGTITVQDAAVKFAELSQSTSNLTAAVQPATTALQTMGGYAPTLIAEFGTGALTTQTLMEKIVSLSQASGLATDEFAGTTVEAGTFNSALADVIATAAAADPRFAALNQKVKDQGTITNDTTLEFLDLLSTIGTVPGTTGPAVTATDALTGSTKTVGTTAAATAGTVQSANKTVTESWQSMLEDIRNSVRELTDAVKTGVGEIVGALKEISQTKVTVDTKSASKSIDELSNDARAAIGWLNKLESETGQKVRFSGGPSGKAAGGYVHAAGGLVMTGELGRELAWMPEGTRITPHWKTAMIEDSLAYGRRGGGGGDAPITLIINGDIYDGDKFRERTIRALRDYRRQGGNV